MGIFMPSIMIGGCLGASLGVAYNHISDQEETVAPKRYDTDN